MHLKTKKLLLASFAILYCCFNFQQVNSQDISIIPAPVKLQVMQQKFTMSSATPLVYKTDNKEIARLAAYFNATIKLATGFELKSQPAGESGILLSLNDKPDQQLKKEGYSLEVTNQKVSIKANTPAGLFYALQTLLQLLPSSIESKKTVNNIKWEVPGVTILDYPRFEWRGLMLDVSRHFFTKAYVKEHIDLMARYKFNRFHWHLTDDNGWRVEIKSLPKLTEVGAWRVPRTGTFNTHEPPKPGEKPTDGGFYTQYDIREIIAYAKERYIEILPEIDVPGHSMAALAAYPELCVTKDTSIKVNPGTEFSKWYGNGKFEMLIDNTLNPTDENVYQFLDKVFTEIAQMFPFEYIHMGGDECYKGYWEKDAKVQAFMKKNNIKNAEELQAYFNKRVTKIVESKKKKIIGWDEILEGGLAEGAAVMSWRGVKGGIEAAHLKHKVVMSPAPTYYIDMRQGDASVEPPIYGDARLKDVYNFNILPAEIDSTYVMGGQGNLWTEQIPTPAQVQYMTYPRAFAIAETLWSPRYRKNWDVFSKNIETHFSRFDAAGYNYSKSMYDPLISVKKDKNGLITIELSTEAKDLDLFYTLDNTIPNTFATKYKTLITLPSGTDQFRVISYRNGERIGNLISLKMEDLVKRIKK